MSGRDGVTVFWIRYLRWCRGTSVVASWPIYTDLLMSQAVGLVAKGRDRNGTIAAAYARLAMAHDGELAMEERARQTTLF